MTSLVHRIYASAATRAFSAAELSDLLATSRANNGRLGITGMLLYAEGSFFQVLEGPVEAVHALYATIERDDRHGEVTTIITESIPKRAFAAWTMGFSTLSRSELAGIGVNDFFEEGRSLAEIDAGRAKKLLAAFRDGRWRSKLSGVREMEAL